MSQNTKTIIIPTVTTTWWNQTSIKAFAAAGRLFITVEYSGKGPRTTSMRRINSRVAVRNSRRRRPFSCSHVFRSNVFKFRTFPSVRFLYLHVCTIFPYGAKTPSTFPQKQQISTLNVTSFASNMAAGVSRVVSAPMRQMEGNRHPSGDGDQDKRTWQIPADAACSFSSGCVKTGEKSRAERRRRRRLPEPRVYIPRVWNYLAASASRLFFPPFTAH